MPNKKDDVTYTQYSQKIYESYDHDETHGKALQINPFCKSAHEFY